MGNSNATAILTEEESSKLESNGMSPLGTVSVETTQDQVFLGGEGKDGDEGKESSKLETNGMSPLDSVSVDTAQDQVFLAGEGKDGDEEKESSKLENNGMSPLDSVSVYTAKDQVFLAGEGKDGDKKNESSNLEINGISLLDSVSVCTAQDQVFLSGDEKDGDREKERSKLETNVMSPGESVSVETTQEQVLLAGKEKDRDEDKEEESSSLETNGMSPLDSIPVDTRQDQLFLACEGKDGDEEKESLPDGVEETEPHSKESVFDESKIKDFEEEIDQNGLESLVMETDEKLQKQTSVAEGVETVSEPSEVEELSIIGTQSVMTKLNSTEFGNEEKLCVIDEIVFESPSLFETEDAMVNESLDVIVHSEEVVKLDQETGMEQRTGREGFPKIEPQETQNLDYRIVRDEEVTDAGKSNKAISNPKPGSQESNWIQETGLGVYKEEKDKIESNLKRMPRCRSLPVSQNSRVIGDLLVQQLVSEVAFPSRNKMGLKKANTSETLLVSCIGSNKAQEATEAITESNKEARLEMRAPSFGHDVSTEKTPLLCQDKNEIYEATIDVEENTVMLKRNESVKTRSIERSLELLKKHSDSLEEIKGSEDTLLDKKGSSASMEGIVRKRSKSSVWGACFCCTTAMS